MSYSGFEIPIDYRDRRQIERGMRSHQHPDSARDGEDFIAAPTLAAHQIVAQVMPN